MALTPAQLGTKSKQMPGHVRAANEVIRGPHLGRVSPQSANYLDRKYATGKLVMLDGGLHRVVSAEPISIRHFFGIPCTITAVTSSTVTVELNDNNQLGTNSQASNLASITPAVGDTLLLGSQTYRQENQFVTVQSLAGGNLGSTTGAVITTAETIVTDRITVGDEATLLRLPAASTSDGAIVLDPQGVDILEPTPKGTSTDQPIYHVSIGVSEHPTLISRAGSTTSLQAHEYEDQVAVLSVSNKSVDGDEVGTGTKPTMVGVIGPSLRVFQPQGVIRFAADEVNSMNISSDKILQGKSGIIEVHSSSESDLNPYFDLWIGAGEETSPEFQIMNRHTNSPLIAPYLVMIGWKYTVRPVPENEVREMIRKSGRFKYEIIPTAFTKSNLMGDSKSAPSIGWRELVQKNRGQRLSFEDYKRLTEQTSSQTRNILYGTTGSRNSEQGADPRNNHRGYN